MLIIAPYEKNIFKGMGLEMGTKAKDRLCLRKKLWFKANLSVHFSSVKSTEARQAFTMYVKYFLELNEGNPGNHGGQ